MKLPALSVLDLFPVEDGVPASRVIQQSVQVAQRAEALGYQRYWIAEHHNTPGIASSAPEVLIAHVAGRTKSIRVGAGGMMLPNHTPLHLVEMFRTLEALYPGRIDMGIGRAPGTDQLTATALQRGSAPVNQQIAELDAFLRASFPQDHAYSRIVTMPNDVTPPPFWMLGSTDAGAQIAAALGVGFAFAGHFSLEHASVALSRYHQEFKASALLAAPRAILALSVICADTDARATELAAPMRRVYARMLKGRFATFPSVASALAEPLSLQDEQATRGQWSNMILGTPERVRDRLLQLCEQLRPDELMISTNVTHPEERLRSFELLAKLNA